MSFREFPGRPKVPLPEWPLGWSKDNKEPNYSLVPCRGLPQNNVHDEKVLNNLIDTFETRDNDVFVCTYVKSGTTWTQQIITLLLNKGEKGDKGYAEAVPWLETAAFGGFLATIEATNWTLEGIKANPNQRFFKSHANLKDLPCGKAPGVKVIYVCRNPKDVCVSLFHHAKNKPLFKYDGDLNDMLKFFAEGRCENGSWFDHVLEWWEASKADPEHVLFLRYEDMVADAASTIKTIADFVGIETSPELIQKTVENSSISAMKKALDKDLKKPGEEANGGEAKQKFMKQHVRKGGAGGWRDVFTVRQSEEFDKLYREQMKDVDLKMDFGEGLTM